MHIEGLRSCGRAEYTEGMNDQIDFSELTEGFESDDSVVSSSDAVEEVSEPVDTDTPDLFN
jgi:hypothetical protein